VKALAVGLSLAFGATAMAWADDASYRDDRSDPIAVIQSYYNAINRHEFARAWSYWGPDGQPGHDFDDFAAGFETTQSVAVVTGDPLADGAAGSVYYSVPVALAATAADGSVTYFAGCYLLRLAQPAIQGVPFQPMHFEQGRLHGVAGEPQGVPNGGCDF